MKIKIFYPNPSGKIEFTREELEALLNEAYEEGRRESHTTYPYISYTDGNPTWTTTTSTPVYLNGGVTVSDYGATTANATSQDMPYTLTATDSISSGSVTISASDFEKKNKKK